MWCPPFLVTSSEVVMAIGQHTIICTLHYWDVLCAWESQFLVCNPRLGVCCVSCPSVAATTWPRDKQSWQRCPAPPQFVTVTRDLDTDLAPGGCTTGHTNQTRGRHGRSIVLICLTILHVFIALEKSHTLKFFQPFSLILLFLFNRVQNEF